MDFFNHKDPFIFRGMPQSWNQALDKEASLQHLNEIKDMLKEYRSVFNQEFWDNANGLTRKKITVLPVELWECQRYIYLSIVAPGLKKLKQANISFQNDQLLRFKIESHSIKPPGAVKLINSELPTETYERDIHLPQPVVSTNYSTSFKDGVLGYTFIKKRALTKKDPSNRPFNIPFDF